MPFFWSLGLDLTVPGGPVVDDDDNVAAAAEGSFFMDVNWGKSPSLSPNSSPIEAVDSELME